MKKEGILNSNTIQKILSLREGNFKDRNLQKEDAIKIADCLLLPSSNSLKELWLQGNNIGDDGLIAICSSLSLPDCKIRLEVLIVAGNNITDRSVQHLSDLLITPSCSLLRINLTKNNIGDTGVASLAKALHHNTSLEYLYLASCNITTKGATSLISVLRNFNFTLSMVLVSNFGNTLRFSNKISAEKRNEVVVLSANKNRLDITKYLPKNVISDPSEKFKYISTLSKYVSRLQLQYIESEIPSSVLSQCQILEYLQRVSKLLDQLQIKLTDIPPSIKANYEVEEYLQVKAVMKSLELTDNQLPKIFSNSLKEQLIYLNELKSGKQSTQKLTIMVVGEEGVGKTSLIKHILSGKWVGDCFDGYDYKKNVNKKKIEKIPRLGITDGIDIHLFQPEGKEFIMNIYDFGGQEIYYSTHQFVLSSQAIYLLLFDASKSINSNRIAHWIHTLSYVAPSSAVFIVGTHFDDPIALKSLPQNLSQLQSILDNIQFLSTEEHSLRFITQSEYNIPLEKNIENVLSTTQYVKHFWKKNRECQIPIWPVSISSSSSISTLLQSVISYAEVNLKKCIIPDSWHSFRSILYPQIHSSVRTTGNKNKNSKIEKFRQQLYSEGSYKIGIMREKELVKIGSEIFNMTDSSVSTFIEFLEYWGDIIYISNIHSSLRHHHDKRYNNLVVLKPSLLISLCKHFITAKKFNSNTNVVSNFPFSFNNSNNTRKSSPSLSQFSDIPHLLNISQLCSKLPEMIDNISSDEATDLVRNYIIPVLIELRLIYPLVVPKDCYFVPAMLRKPPSHPHLQIIKNHPLLKIDKPKNLQLSKSLLDVVLVKRVYEFVYLPSGMFTRLMMEVWKHFNLISEFAHNLQHEDMFWEDGFIISDCSSSNIKNGRFDYQNHQICIIQTTTHSQNGNINDSNARSIILKLSSPESKLGSIIPVIHRAIVNSVIQPLEFESGKNRSKIYCSALTSTYSHIPPPSYEYDRCFQSISLQNNNDDSNNNNITLDNNCSSNYPNDRNPPLFLLRFLIPEYFHVAELSIKRNNSRNSQNNNNNNNNDDQLSSLDDNYARYQNEVREVKVLGEGAGGEVWYGYWHSQEVAIKKPYSNEIPAILNEINLLQSLHHPNLLKLLDIYHLPSSSSSSLIIITEYCREGDLLNILNKQDMIHPILMCCIVRDIAEGLSYLHNHSPPILHCDVRPPNIFIKSLKLKKGEVCAVLGDVGFARIADDTTRTAGSKSTQDDIGGLLHILSLFDELLNYRIVPTQDIENENVNNNNIDNKVEKNEDYDYQRSIKSIFEKIRNIIEDVNYRIDGHLIAELLSNDIILPFFEKNSNNQLKLFDLQHEYVNNDLNLHLHPSPHFPAFQNLINQQFTSDNALILLSQCISLLQGVFSSDHAILPTATSNIDDNNRGDEDDEYWHAICRYVIPIIGYAIEEDMLTIDHIIQLDNIMFYYHPLGDIKSGMTLFHYACLSANMKIIAALYIKHSKYDINQATYLPSGSAAIHLAMSSLKHRGNKEGVKGTLKVLNFLISHGANINLQDLKGETILFKAAMEGAYKLVVHLLNYPQSVDVHIISKEGISAIVAAARYSSESHLLCIKVLLQIGCEFSPSIRSVISNDELERIRSVANSLICDTNSVYARYPHCTLAIYSWLSS